MPPPSSTCPPLGHPDTPLDTIRQTYGAVAADVIALGHLHFPDVQWVDGKLLVNVSLVAPHASRPGRRTFTLLAWKHERWGLQQIDVQYDITEEARLRAAQGMPHG